MAFFGSLQKHSRGTRDHSPLNIIVAILVRIEDYSSIFENTVRRNFRATAVWQAFLFLFLEYKMNLIEYVTV